MTSATPPSGVPRSPSPEWAAAVEELRQMRREETAAENANEEATEAELRRAFAHRKEAPTEGGTPNG